LAHRIENAVGAHRTRMAADRRRHRFEQILKTTPGCVVQLNTDGQFVFANQRATEVLGLERSAVTDRTYNDPDWEIRTPDGDPIPDEELPFRRVRDTQEPLYGYQHSIRWPDGERKMLLVNGAPVHANGDLSGVVFSLTDITERYEQQQTLEETRRRLDMALEATDTGVWEWNRRSDEVFWNETLERVMGLEPGEFEGTFEAFLDRVHPDDQQSVTGQIRDAIETEQSYRTEFRMLDADGDVRWVAVRGRLVDDDRMVGVHQDITERKHLESKLDASADQYRTLVDNVPGGAVFLYNEELECVRAGGAELTAVGLSPEEIHGARPRDRYPEEIAVELENHLRAAFDGDRREFHQRHHGETYRVQTVPIEDGTGDIDRVMAVSRKVTDQVKRERTLERLHEATRKLITASTAEEVASVGSETAAEVLDLPRNGIHLYEEADDALVPVAWTDESESVIGEPPPTLPVAESLAGRVYRTGTAELYEDVHRHEGRYDPDSPFRSELCIPLGDHGVMLVSSPDPDDIDDADETLARVLAANIEAALDRIHREEQLTRQNKRLEEFAGIVSHDLQNPLSVAKGRLELARESGLGDDDHLKPAATAVDRCLELTNDLLTLAREEGSTPDLERIDLAAIVEDCWQTVETADATLVVETDRTVQADSGQLKRLLENLLRNAVIHAARTAPESDRADDAEDKSVTVRVGGLGDGFYVADDGPGIPPDARDQVFEPGYSTATDGTGFGLNIVDDVASTHGWAVTACESETGGARFEITGLDADE
jgi:PAS domain S-box-containing protein